MPRCHLLSLHPTNFTTVKSRTLILAFLCLLGHTAFAQVTNTSYTTRTGEKVLRLSIVVPVDRAKAWELFSTEDGLKKWAAPVVKLDLRTGGSIRTNYDKTKTADDSSAIVLGIVNYIENELITLKVNLNGNFSQAARSEDQNLQEIIQLEDAGKGKTKIIASMMGWGRGPHWDKVYQFFEKGNTWTYQEMLKAF